MSKLTAQKRNNLPAKEFALSSEKKYPINDRSHAINAKARATQMNNKGMLSSAKKTKIDERANRVLDKGNRGCRG